MGALNSHQGKLFKEGAKSLNCFGFLVGDDISPHCGNP